MSRRHNTVRDAFAFSVRGLTTTAFGGASYLVADDAINKAWDEKLKKTPGKCGGSADCAAAPAPRVWRSVFGLSG